MGFESQMIDDNEFLLKQVDAPLREEVTAHECVCLLIKGPEPTPEVMAAMEKAATAAGLGKEIISNMIGNKDKCHRMVDSPDQAFCDGCEEEEHHLLPNQIGGARNIHRRGRNA